MLYNGSNRVDVVTADAGNLGIFYVRVHQHSGNACGLQLFDDLTRDLRSHDHQAAKVVFLAELLQVWGILIGAVLNHHLVVVGVCCLLKSRKNRITDLRVAVRIHILKQNANTLGILIAVQGKTD